MYRKVWDPCLGWDVFSTGGLGQGFFHNVVLCWKKKKNSGVSGTSDNRAIPEGPGNTVWNSEDNGSALLDLSIKFLYETGFEPIMAPVSYLCSYHLACLEAKGEWYYSTGIKRNGCILCIIQCVLVFSIEWGVVRILWYWKLATLNYPFIVKLFSSSRAVVFPIKNLFFFTFYYANYFPVGNPQLLRQITKKLI